MNLLFFYSMLILLILILIKIIKQETREYLASFMPPIGTPSKDKETMREDTIMLIHLT